MHAAAGIRRAKTFAVNPDSIHPDPPTRRVRSFPSQPGPENLAWAEEPACSSSSEGSDEDNQDNAGAHERQGRWLSGVLPHFRDSTWWQDLTRLERSWIWLNDPTCSYSAYAWASIMVFLIVLGSVTFVLESLPALCCGRFDWLWEPIEIVCVAAFTGEYVARFVSCPWYYPAELSLKKIPKDRKEGAEGTVKKHILARVRFLVSALNIVDMAAILPLYIEIVAGGAGASFLRIFRLLRVLRLLKLSKYSEGLQLMAKTLKNSLFSLAMLMFAQGIFVILCASAAYFIERGERCDETNNFCSGTAELPLGSAEPEAGFYAIRGTFEGATWSGDGCISEHFCRRRVPLDSIPIALYWSVQTITTTGYGDLVPDTFLGKCVAVVTMLMGLVMLALPITIISENFALEYQRRELIRMEREEKQRVRLQKRANKAMFQGKGQKGRDPVKGEMRHADHRKRHVSENQIEPKPAVHSVDSGENSFGHFLLRERDDEIVPVGDDDSHARSIQQPLSNISCATTHPGAPGESGASSSESKGGNDRGKGASKVLPGQPSSEIRSDEMHVGRDGALMFSKAPFQREKSFFDAPSEIPGPKASDEELREILEGTMKSSFFNCPEADVIQFKRSVDLLFYRHRVLLFRALQEKLEGLSEIVVDKVLTNLDNFKTSSSLMKKHASAGSYHEKFSMLARNHLASPLSDRGQQSDRLRALDQAADRGSKESSPDVVFPGQIIDGFAVGDGPNKHDDPSSIQNPMSEIVSLQNALQSAAMPVSDSGVDSKGRGRLRSLKPLPPIVQSEGSPSHSTHVAHGSKSGSEAEESRRVDNQNDGMPPYKEFQGRCFKAVPVSGGVD